MNKNIAKIISSMLCVSMLMGGVQPTYASTKDTQSTSSNEKKEVEVLYNKSASYFVTIPKTITLDSNKESSYSVKVDGDIASDQEVYVSPIDSIGNKDGFNFYMKDQSTKHPKADVIADVTQNKFYWDYEDAANAYEETNNNISASDLSSGAWKGTFDFEINMHRISNEKGLTLSTDGDVTMGLDDTLQVNAYLDGTPVTNEVSWSSSNSSVSVEKGLLKTSASAEVGDSSTITVVADTKEQLASVEKALSNVGIMTAHADDTLTASFKVTIVDIELSSYDLYIKPGESATLNATILPLGTEGTVNWTRTAVSGLNLKKNGNSVEIFIASDMEVGKTYQVVASFGDFSKVCTIHIGESAHKHTYTSRVTKEPTCTEAGETTFTCVDGDDSYTQVIQPLGHNFSSEYTVDKEPTHTEAGSKSQHCSRCDAKQNVTSIPATGHKYNDGVVTKKPTCTEKGVKTFTCVDGDHSYTEEIPAIEHNYGEATYTWSSDKSTCTAKRVCANDASHVETETVNTTSTITKNATCTTTGTKTYTATFKNGAFAKQTTTSTIPALGHDFNTEYTVDKEPTHTEDGSKSQHCKRCGAKQNVISISATGHIYNVGIITKNPTCTEPGTKTYTCIGGDHTYTEEIPATGHKYGTPTYTWSNDKSTCTAKRVCANDASHVETETVNSTNAITTKATCDKVGIKTYTATFKNSAFAKQTSTSSIPATGHKYGTPTYTWSADGKTCTAKRVCANNSSHIETENATITNKVKVNANCTTKGTTTYTATFKNSAFTTQTKDVQDINALGHNYASTYTIDKNATCTETGSKSQHCSRCGAKQNVTSIPATGHKYGAVTYTWSNDKSTCTAKRVCANDASHIETEIVNSTNAITKNATCTETGIKTYTATFKNGAFAKQTTTSTIPALGHNFSTDYIIDKEPTHTEDGSKSQHCTRCGAKQNIITISATGHTYNAGVITKNPTCTEKGLKTYTCIGGDHTYTEEIPATGHKYGAPTYTWSSDKSTCTAKRVCANDASHIETETVKATSTITKAATCTEAGEARNSVTFKNSAFANQTTTSTIPAKGHNYVDGKCTICGEELLGDDVELTSSNLSTYGISTFWDVTIPSVVTDSDGTKHKVTSIGKIAFKDCRYLTSITIPDSVTSIGDSAFYKCHKLTSITIPNSVTSIGSQAFGECSSLTSITIPNGVTSIGCSTFYECRGLTSINIPESVRSIGYDAFFDCSKLTSITIPDSVTSIERRAFGRCSGLTSITIPDSVTSIGDAAFYYCTNLASITYKGVNYTNETELTNALKSNGVSLETDTFYGTKLQ